MEPQLQADGAEPDSTVLSIASVRRIAALWGLVAAVIFIDLIADAPTAKAEPIHFAMEVLGFTMTLAALFILLSQILAARRRARLLEGRLMLANEDARRWREEAQAILHGLSDALDRQFERWQFTSAERDVALMLLKGFSHKEIAKARQTNENTVRQQAGSIYRKAKLSGRAELSGFFLEDLLQPRGQSTPPSK